MRFEFAIAAKYLIPRIKQLSVSIISLLSLLVISLVVWLVLVFLSVTDGLEKNWIDKLISLNAPMRLTPTDAYFQSYYYQIDALSEGSHFRAKSIREKLGSEISNPYDPTFDAEIPEHISQPIYNSDGSLQDIVKETFQAIHSLEEKKIKVHDYEIGLATFHLQLAKEGEETFFEDTAYIASLPQPSQNFTATCLEPSGKDLQNILMHLVRFTPLAERDSSEQMEKSEDPLSSFFEHVHISSLKTAKGGFVLPPEVLPNKVRYTGLALFKEDEIVRFIIPRNEHSKNHLKKLLKEHGLKTLSGTLRIKTDEWTFIDTKKHIKKICGIIPVVLDEDIILNATLDATSLSNAKNIHDIYFYISTDLQGKALKGRLPLSYQLQIGDVKLKNHSTSTSYWLYKTDDSGEYALPASKEFGQGVLIAKGFKDKGVLVGDTGYLSYKTATLSAIQEQRLPVFVAGFYDPGIIPIAGKIVLTNPELANTIRTSTNIQGNGLGNGIQVWFEDLDRAPKIKIDLEKKLKEKGLSPYWKIETFQEYEFSKDLVQQLKSDKNLFTLIAIIIIIVACSNIISMLILLVNDKKREIGILQSMGASSWNIAIIFGTCGIILGLISSLVGTFAAFMTLRHMDTIVFLLSSLQGFDAFNHVFYGDALPNQMSPSALQMVWIATCIISLCAGLIPAIKASLLKPASVLRSE